MSLPFIAPIPRNHLPRRLIQLYLGLIGFGVGAALLVLSGLGLDPWDVFHQGLARHTGIPLGTWAIVVGAAVLILWIPLRQQPGIGTISNAVVIGLVINAVLGNVPAPSALPLRVACLVLGVLITGAATGLYIGAGLGTGPRDGLMMGISRRGPSIRVTRTSIELTVLITGWLLGGTVGIGTVVYALSIGPLAHYFIPLLAVGDGPAAPLPAVDVVPQCVDA